MLSVKKRSRKFTSLLHWTEFKISMTVLFNKALSQKPRAGRVARCSRPKAGPPVLQLIDNQVSWLRYLGLFLNQHTSGHP